MTVRGHSLGGATISRTVFIRRLLIVAVAINLSFLGLTGLFLRQSHLQYEERALISTKNLATAIAGRVDADVDKVDLAVQAVVDETERQLGSGRIDTAGLNAFIAHQQDRVPAMNGLRVVSPAGENVYGAGTQTNLHANVSDREYFQQLRTNNYAGLVVSGPLVGRVSKQWSLILARRINQPDGTFAGLVYGSIALDHFKGMFSTVDLGSKGAVTLRNNQLALIYRYPEPPSLEGYFGQKNASPELLSAVLVNPGAGTYHSDQAFDKIDRTYSYCVTTDQPFYVVVGLSAADYFETWFNEAMWDAVLAAAFILASALATWLVYREWTSQALQMETLALQKEALQESEDRYRRLVEDSTDTIYIESDGKIIFINPAGLRLLGASSPEQVLGKAPADFIHPDFRPTALQRPVDTRSARTHTGKYLRLDGGTVDVDATAIPLAYYHKSGTQVILHDLTERNQLEAQLRQAQKLEALGTLAGGTAHEFNNMLGIIMGNCDLLSLELSSHSAGYAELSEIKEASLRAKEIVQQILAFSRVQKEARHFIPLHAAVLDAIRLLRKILPETVDIQANIPPGPAILGNVTQIHQAVTNLCVNAWHALPGERGIVRLTQTSVTLDADATKLHPGLHAGPYLRLAISDNGKGISKEVLARIFEPFFTTKAPGKGTGLGLAVVHGIMQSHDGAVLVHSEPGKGTTFDLYFPACLDAQVKTADPVVPSNPTGSGQHILVVDDEPSLTRVAAKCLQRLGYRATEVHSAAAAIKIVGSQEAAFALVITDLTMPEINGINLAKSLQATHPQLPIVLASGFDMERTAETDYPPNIRTRLQKPYTTEVLAQVLQTIFTSTQK